MGTWSERITMGSGKKLGEEADAKHVVDYVAPDGINFDQPPNKCR